MTLLNRETLIDRPEVFSSDNEDEEDEGTVVEKTSADEDIEVLGEGGGRVVNGVEFEEGDSDIIEAAEVVSVLASGNTEGELYQASFLNSAIQLKSVANSGVSVSEIVTSGVKMGVDEASTLDFEVDEDEGAEETSEENEEDAESETDTEATSEDGEQQASE
jgi:hypothetical protein